LCHNNYRLTVCKSNVFHPKDFAELKIREKVERDLVAGCSLLVARCCPNVPGGVAGRFKVWVTDKAQRREGNLFGRT